MRENGKRLIAAASVLLLASGLGCGFITSLLGGETATPEPSPPAPQEAPPTTAPPVESAGGTVPLEHPFAGVDLEYPAGWATEMMRGMIALAESQTVLDSQDFSSGPILLVITQPADEMTEETGETTEEGLLNAVLEDFGGEGPSQIGDFETRQFAHQEGMGVMLWWTENEASLQGYLAAYLDEDVGVLMLAAAPEARWDEAWPSFDNVMHTMVFYAPLEAIERGGLELGGTATATLDPGGTDAWTYRSSGDEYVMIEVVTTDEWDPTLEVLNETGNSLAFDDDSGEGLNPRLSSLYLAMPGQYEIRVSTFSGNGEYQITISTAEPPGGGTITYGETVESAIESGEQEAWTFEGNAGDQIAISMVGAEDLTDTYLELYGPDGTLLTIDDDSGEGFFALIQEYTLPQTGTYRIIARAFSDESGPYTLTLERLEIEEQPIAYGQTLAGEITEEHPREYWTFEGTAGDVVTISMVGTGDLTDTYLELYGPDGTLLTEDDDSGEGFFALIQEYELPQSGAYRIVARAWGDRVGEYELSLTKAP